MPVYKDKKRNTYYYSVYVDLPNGEKKRFMKRGFKSKKKQKMLKLISFTILMWRTRKTYPLGK